MIRAFPLCSRLPSLAFGACLLLCAAALTGGCATRPDGDNAGSLAAYEEANDPMEPLNRYFFELTNFADYIALRPAAEIYDGIMPHFARRRLRAFIGNLGTPVTFIHDVLQGSWGRAGRSLFRLTVNSTLGIGGLFDVADMMGYPGHSEDMGQTLAVYGVPEGPYLFLPFAGPSSFRAAAGRVGDYYMDPVGYIPLEGRSFIRLTTGAMSVVDQRASALEILDQVERTSIDYYAVLRELYRQNRQRAILNGAVDISALPDISEDVFDFDETEDEDFMLDGLDETPMPSEGENAP